MNDKQYGELVRNSEGIKARGFFRVKIVDPEMGEACGDSLWNQNVEIGRAHV